jgi:hypothetical protein
MVMGGCSPAEPGWQLSRRIGPNASSLSIDSLDARHGVLFDRLLGFDANSSNEARNHLVAGVDFPVSPISPLNQRVSNLDTEAAMFVVVPILQLAYEIVIPSFWIDVMIRLARLKAC